MAPAASSSKKASSSKASSSKTKITSQQATLNGFGFKGGAKKTSTTSKKDTDEDDNNDDEDDATDDEPEEGTANGKKTKNKKQGRPDLSDLPPLTDIPSIFADIVQNIPAIIELAKQLKGRKIRVATMCSGTESPLLALDLVARALKKDHGVTIKFEHIFSCEIVPWKQAYIERNFQPPLLFRDVTELGNDEATTAYGAKAEVPLDVDMLIAGTSCVDYSTLNNAKQDIDAKGESGETFRGMLRWVDRARPTIVILENVCGAPWKKVQTYFEEVNYSATFSRFDTKNYYIPHTRTRVYLFAVNLEDSSSKPKKWLEMVKSLQRPASVPYDAFLLDSDDPRIQQGREKLIKEEHNRTRTIDWSKCETRHARARLEEKLGMKRPLTYWNENGSCKILDFAWTDWSSTQVDRVWDLMDISYMRAAAKGTDATYKSILWNLSQNVDRQIGSSIAGISPCLTPTMIAYLNFRGGPMLGVEALALQGLPVNELVLTRETEDNLADLAGNAMSSTVVGTAMLSALIICKDLLMKALPRDEDEDESMAVDDQSATIPGEEKISGFAQLQESPLDLAKIGDQPLEDLLAKAAASARLCACEGRETVSTNTLWLCQDCAHTVCSRCGGRPEHNFTTVTTPRERPLFFQKAAKDSLPMCVNMSDVDPEMLAKLRADLTESIDDRSWKAYTKAVLAAVTSEMRFHSLRRQEIWVAKYDSTTGFLLLHLDPQRPQWLLFAKPSPSEPTNSHVRKMLSQPVARLKITDHILKGTWEFALPLQSSFDIEISGVVDTDAEGEGLVLGWEPRLGLQHDDLKEKKVWAKINIHVAEEDQSKLDHNLAGVYRWLPGCAAANSSLHVKEDTSPGSPPIYFFLDPTRWGENDEDPFVFSTTHKRFDYGEARPILATLEPWYRQGITPKETVTCSVPYRWVKAPIVTLQAAGANDAVYSAPSSSLQFNVGIGACETAQAILTCKVRLPTDADENIWQRGKWVEVDKVHERVTYQMIAFLTERLREVPNQGDWLPTDYEGVKALECDTCSPTPPTVKFVLDPKGRSKRAMGLEDAEEAGEFERALKRRPSPFVTQLRRDEENVGHVRIGINIASLTHRVITRLPTEGRTNRIVTSYRLTTDYMPPAKLIRPKFVLTSNKRDALHPQPPHFRRKLRPEQQRSLKWMIAQEREDVAEFEEEEIAEAIIEPLGWRAEAKASRKVRVRGGVLADEVGYGKTVITLGLISCQSQAYEWSEPPEEIRHGLIAVKATLVIVPAHLVMQWESEVTKFTKKRFVVLAMASVHQLKKVSIKDIMEADIVIIPSTALSSAAYLARLAALGGEGELPPSYGRYWRDRLSKTLDGVREQAKRLVEENGVKAVWDVIIEGDKKDNTLKALPKANPSKRLRGQAFRKAAEAKAMGAEDDDDDVKPVKPTKPVKLTGQKMRDVYITVTADDLRKSSASVSPKTSAPASTDVEMDDAESSTSAADKRPKRRASKVSAIVLSDDDDEEDKKPKKSAKSKSKGGKKKEDLDDFIVPDEDTDDEVSSAASSSSVASESEPESDGSTKKGKGKAKAKLAAAKPKAKAAPKKAAAPPKKRKSTAVSDADEKPKKKPKAEPKPKPVKPSVSSQDPWELKTPVVKADWRKMKAPAFEMFHWNRIVVDEYTYLKDEAHCLITQLQATHRWVLSGTPPIHDFASLKTIAVFLGVHLGVDDEDENPTSERGGDRTAVEKFHSFREIRSVNWYLNRYQVGQRFLDQYMRQNIAEIDEIKFEEHIELIQLPAAERALERELDHTLRAQEMMLKRGKKTQSHRDQRIMKSLRESSSAEEALLKCVAYYDNVQSGSDNAMKACDYVVKVRKQELEECQDDIHKTLLKLEKQRKALGRVDGETHYEEWIRVSKEKGVGDHEASEIAMDIYEHARSGKPWKKKGDDSKDDDQSEADEDSDEPKKGKKVKGDEAKADAIWKHRETTHALRQLIRELVGRVRSYRYFENVRRSQQENLEFTIDCGRCGRKDVPREEISLLSSCGHMGCSSCVTECAKDDHCLLAKISECQTQAQQLNIVPAVSLGTDDEIKDARRHFGKKLEVVVDLIKNRIPDEERTLMFVQYDDLMKKVLEALQKNDISCLQIQGNAKQQSEKLTHFQSNEAKEKVLLLSLEDESASGANLTIANHIIFLSPMFAKSKEHYMATETQAIGRIRRYGQLKTANVWRIVARDTIDVEVYQRFSGRNFQREVDEGIIQTGTKAPIATLVEDDSAPSSATSTPPPVATDGMDVEEEPVPSASTRATSTASSTAEVSAIVANLSVAPPTAEEPKVVEPAPIPAPPAAEDEDIELLP